ncbi:hypothetical protein [Candidatus Hecatella orcuttiae]|jgi:hypothetical protein|uniref:hypothetical protein n=1 Tax=Candidatus Hecatella orcuttiae TaxID=1935119 RepID=UPI002867CB95|nr:hypothetical protein [Candidatus Hecatella orcuttiae]
MSAEQARVAIILEAQNKAKAVLAEAQRDVRSFSQQAQASARGAGQAADRMGQRMAAAARTSQVSFSQVSMGMTTLAASAMNLYNAYDRIGTVQARVAALQASYKAAQDAVAAAQLRLNKLAEAGKEGSEEYRIAQEKLATAQQRLAAYEVNKAYIQMAMSVLPAVMGSMQALQGMKGMGGLVSVAPKVVAAMHSIRTASYGMLGPLGLLIAAAATLYLAWTQNWGGIREKVGAVVEWFSSVYTHYIQPTLEAIVGGFQWLADRVTWLWDRTLGPIVEGAKRLYDALVGRSVFPELMHRLEAVTAKGLGETVALWHFASHRIAAYTQAILAKMTVSQKAARFFAETAVAPALARGGFAGVTSRGQILAASIPRAEYLRGLEESLRVSREVYGYGPEHPAVRRYEAAIAEVRGITIIMNNQIQSPADEVRLAKRVGVAVVDAATLRKGPL